MRERDTLRVQRNDDDDERRREKDFDVDVYLGKDEEGKKRQQGHRRSRAAVLTTLAASPFAAFAQEALAKDGEFGVLEGRSAALVHPIFLGIMYVTTISPGMWAGSGEKYEPSGRRFKS